jgi:hypothetical protein
MSKLYQCLDCNYSSTRRGNYERHLLSPLHLNGKKQYKCEQCQVSFKQKGHLLAHYESNKHKGICPIVDKRKLKQTEGYLKDYTFKLNCKIKKLKVITDRMDNGRELQGDEKLYDELEIQIPKLQVKRKEHHLKYKKMYDDAVRKLLSPYFNPQWRAVALWFHNMTVDYYHLLTQ